MVSLLNDDTTFIAANICLQIFVEIEILTPFLFFKND